MKHLKGRPFPASFGVGGTRILPALVSASVEMKEEWEATDDAKCERVGMELPRPESWNLDSGAKADFAATGS